MIVRLGVALIVIILANISVFHYIWPSLWSSVNLWGLGAWITSWGLPAFITTGLSVFLQSLLLVGIAAVGAMVLAFSLGKLLDKFFNNEGDSLYTLLLGTLGAFLAPGLIFGFGLGLGLPIITGMLFLFTSTISFGAVEALFENFAPTYTFAPTYAAVVPKERLLDVGTPKSQQAHHASTNFVTPLRAVASLPETNKPAEEVVEVTKKVGLALK